MPRMARAKRDYTESAEVAAFVEYMKAKHPRVLFYKIQNEGKRSKRIAGMLGIRAGVPDLHFVVARYPWHSYYIEMKRRSASAKLSTSQKLVIAKLIDEGHAVDVCYGFDEAIESFERYLVGQYKPSIKTKLDLELEN